MDSLLAFFRTTGLYEIFDGFARLGELSMDTLGGSGLGSLIMVAIACGLLYLGIGKKFEPLLMVPIAFGMLLSNLPLSAIFASEGDVGLLYYFYTLCRWGILPPLIFMGVGAMTDFGPLISNPKSLLLGAAAQIGIFSTFFMAKYIDIPYNAVVGFLNGTFGWNIQALAPFTGPEAASIAIIGGADGPTAIYVTSILASGLLGSIAVAAYSYMALVPVIQPPIMKALTTKKERSIVMTQLRPVSRTEKIIFPILCTIIISLILPDSAILIGMLMLGNLMKESGVVERINRTAGNELMNIITIFLALSVGCTTSANTFLNTRTLFIIVLGLIAFSFGTAAGVLCGKVMYKLTGGQVNPLIGSAGVSAVPMAARVSQVVGQKENPSNFLLMHAMGPNVAGVIGSAIAAGVLMSLFG